MSTPLEELFKQALDAVTMLGGEAMSLHAIFSGDTGCGISLIAHMRAFIELVENEGKECIQLIGNLALNVEHSEHDLTTAGDAAEAALKQVHDDAPNVTTHAEAVETHTHDKATEIEHERTEATTLLKEGMVHAREDAARVRQAAEALGALLSTRIEETRTAMGELQHAVQEAGTELAAAAQRFQEAAAEVDRVATADSGLYVAAMDALAHQAATHLTSFANVKVDAHNETVGPLRQRMTLDEPRALNEMVQDVVQHMQQILRLCDERDDALVSSAESLEPMAHAATGRFEQILQFTDLVLSL
jgi:chromosome segregation ATPase